MATKKAQVKKKKGQKTSRSAPGKALAAKRQEPTRGARTICPPSPPALGYRLHALLGTVRSIAGYEDHLCTLLHEVQTHGTVSPELTRDLVVLLDEIPAPGLYLEEIEAIRRVMPEPVPASRPANKRLPKKSLATVAKRKQS